MGLSRIERIAGGPKVPRRASAQTTAHYRLLPAIGTVIAKAFLNSESAMGGEAPLEKRYFDCLLIDMT
jgi:hypothetical protein